MSEVIVLDTHIWIWLINGNLEKIPETWLEQIELANSVGISPLSYYEVALAVQKGRLFLPSTAQEWFKQSLEITDIGLFPLTADIAYQAVNLSPLHKDPFDRMIIATALSYGAKLASVDRLFSQYDELKDCLMSIEAKR
jgi:PIN domain nuclease of toxin-antitoxin system